MLNIHLVFIVKGVIVRNRGIMGVVMLRHDGHSLAIRRRASSRWGSLVQIAV